MDVDFYLLTYDIADPRRLARVAKVMESIGERVQYSVFEAYLPPDLLEQVVGRVRKVMNEDEDSLRIYRLCAACRKDIRTLGVGQVTPPPETIIL
ncbi:MAG: CRISPR-associated endonuclease Cas2 [Anaerolineae bacterium]|nr:MAG: CRISPR-associated endonuclease Cas2 [Anaerolineae bacterium]